MYRGRIVGLFVTPNMSHSAFISMGVRTAGNHDENVDWRVPASGRVLFQDVGFPKSLAEPSRTAPEPNLPHVSPVCPAVAKRWRVRGDNCCCKGLSGPRGCRRASPELAQRVCEDTEELHGTMGMQGHQGGFFPPLLAARLFTSICAGPEIACRQTTGTNSFTCEAAAHFPSIPTTMAWIALTPSCSHNSAVRPTSRLPSSPSGASCTTEPWTSTVLRTRFLCA